MKATVDNSGSLKIYAESDLESFALKMWFQNYQSSTSKDPTFLVIDLEDYKKTEK